MNLSTVVSKLGSPDTLGQAIATARKAKNLTQQQLCAQTGIAYSTLTKIERGAIKQPNVFIILQIAQATGSQIEDLLNHHSLTQRLTTKETPAQPTTAVKFVYFDLHRVLINSSASMLTTLAAEVGVVPAVIEDFYLRYNVAACKGQVSLDELNQALRDEFGLAHLRWTDHYLRAVYPQPINDYCTKLMDNYPVGLLTNAFPGNVTALMEAQIISDNFKVIVDSSVVGYVKPEKAIYTYAQEQAGVKAEEILLIDDNKINILAAQTYGWQGLLFTDWTAQETDAKLRDYLNF